MLHRISPLSSYVLVITRWGDLTITQKILRSPNALYKGPCTIRAFHHGHPIAYKHKWNNCFINLLTPGGFWKNKNAFFDILDTFSLDMS